MAFEGLLKNGERRYRETGSDSMKAEYETFMNITPCSECGGQRLKRGALAVTVGGQNIAAVTALSINCLLYTSFEIAPTSVKRSCRSLRLASSSANFSSVMS